MNLSPDLNLRRGSNSLSSDSKNLNLQRITRSELDVVQRITVKYKNSFRFWEGSNFWL